MIMKNCEVSTEYEYIQDDEDTHSCGRRTEVLQIKISVPGGQVIYKLPVTKEFVSNIEIATELIKS